MEYDEARRRLAGARRAVLATITDDGRPHAVPITFAVAGERLYTAVDDKPKTTTGLKRLANIRARPAVTVLVDAYDDDWTRLWWVRADGSARVVEAGEEYDAAIRALTDKYDQYRQRPPSGPAVVIEIDRVASWAAT